MEIEKMKEMSMLFDFYGKLLNEKRFDIFRYYHEDNLSLAEISEELGISRQGVHDSLKKSEGLLKSYEEKLKLIEKFSHQEKVIHEINTCIDELILENIKDELVKKLNEVKKSIDSLID